LVTVGQALHWFDLPAFYKEVKRVAKPNALLAVWGYSLLNISPEINLVISRFYTDIIGPYWDKERKLVDDQYKTILFPFKEINTPEFEFSFQWNLDSFQGYISTWSSVQKYKDRNGVDPVSSLITDLKPLWREREMKVTFPLFLRLGKIHP